MDCKAFAFALAAFASSAAAAPAKPAPAQPAVIARAIACASIGNPQERLACYDKEIAGLKAATASGDLVAMDRQQVRKTRRSLFGLVLPDLGIFGDSSDDAPSSLETTLRAAKEGPDGRWVFDLAEGGRWVQIDSREFIVDPAPGQPIRIRRAAFGSYLANVNKQIAVRVRRVN